MKTNFKPGKGWRHAGGSVYEFNGGLRIHIPSLCRLSSGTLIWSNSWAEIGRVERMIDINGGNRKRGLMAWARRLEENNG